MEFSRQGYWSGWPFPSPGALPNSGMEPRSLTLQADSLLFEPPEESQRNKDDSQKLQFCFFSFLPTQESERRNCALLQFLARLLHTSYSLERLPSFLDQGNTETGSPGSLSSPFLSSHSSFECFHGRSLPLTSPQPLFESCYDLISARLALLLSPRLIWRAHST